MKTRNLRRAILTLAAPALFFFASGFALADEIYVSVHDDNNSNRKIMKFDLSGQGSVFTSSGLFHPDGLAFDSSGNLYVANWYYIEKYDAAATPSFFASESSYWALGGLAFDSSGNLYVANFGVGGGDSTIDQYDLLKHRLTFASPPDLNGVMGLALDSSGNLYAANNDVGTIEIITPQGKASVFARNLQAPVGLAFDCSGNLYVANSDANEILKFTPSGNRSVFASSGLYWPWGLAFDSYGNLYVANEGDGTIEKFDANGNGIVFASGLDQPWYIAVKKDAVYSSYTVAISNCCTLIANQFYKPCGNALDNIMPVLPVNCRFLKYNNSSGTWTTTTYSTRTGWADGSITLNPGEGAFLCPCCPTNFSLTFSGLTYFDGSNQLSSMGLVSRMTNAPGTYETITKQNPPDGAMVWKWNCGGYTAYTYVEGVGWCDADGNPVPDPMAAVGQAMWADPTGGSGPPLPPEVECPTNYVTGAKFYDLNGDGVWETNEPGLGGWTINAYDAATNLVATTITDSNGQYQLPLPCGTYTIREVNQSGWSQTFPTNGCYVVTAGSGPNTNLNFGNVTNCATISGGKFQDLNGNGIRDDGEPWLPGWTIRLFIGALPDKLTPFLTAQTDANGQYSFTVPAGTYTITEDSRPNWCPTTPTNGYYAVTLDCGGQTNLNFGNTTNCPPPEPYNLPWPVLKPDTNGASQFVISKPFYGLLYTNTDLNNHHTWYPWWDSQYATQATVVVNPAASHVFFRWQSQ